MAEVPGDDEPFPDGHVVDCEVTVTSWFDRDGEGRISVRTTSDRPVSSYLGLLEMAKHELLGYFLATEEP